MEFRSPVCIFLPVILVVLCVDVAACSPKKEKKQQRELVTPVQYSNNQTR